MADGKEELSMCPSFSSYSSDRLAEIAAKTTGMNLNDALENENEEDDDFEFALVGENQALIEEFCYDGKINPIFPIFNRNLLVNNDDFSKNSNGEVLKSSDKVVESIRIPLKKLFIDDRDRERESSSSSEVDELESIPPGTYCVWMPKATEPSSSQCKKSKSTGSASKRWKFRDLLRRCNSDGKDSNSFVFLMPKQKDEKPDKIENSKREKAKQIVTGRGGEKLPASSPSPHEALYVRNRTITEGNKKRSYLPYRQDLVGFFVNANGLGRSFPPF